MKEIRNNIIPFKGYKAINICGVLFVRKGATMRDVDYNHEEIHTAQMKELWYIGFYILYLAYWVANLMSVGFNKDAYYQIPFEQEAYKNQSNLSYLTGRSRFAWKNY